MEWFKAELTPQKAEYHLGVLADIPFRNLQLLQLHFHTAICSVIRPECWEALALWIGQYLLEISILDMATTVQITTNMGNGNMERLIRGAMGKPSTDLL